jgi:hypothetical protein
MFDEVLLVVVFDEVLLVVVFDEVELDDVLFEVELVVFWVISTNSGALRDFPEFCLRQLEK